MRVSASEITVHNGDKVLAEVIRAFEAGDSVLDFSGVTRIDSTALALILAAKRVLKSDKKMELLHAPEQLNSLIQAYGVQSLFP